MVQRIFREYVHEGRGVSAISRQLNEEGFLPNNGREWCPSRLHCILGNETYRGTCVYGRTRKIATEDGTRVYSQPEDTWITVPVPPLVDEETWDRAQKLKKQRLARSKRNTRQFYLLQKILRCAGCGRMFGARSNNSTTSRRNGKLYCYDAAIPRRYCRCYGADHHVCSREHPYIRAERLEDLVWGEVSRILQSPELIVEVIRASDAHGGDGVAEETANTERDLRNVEIEDERAVRLFVSGKITERQLDRQRKLITERRESLRARLDDCRARQASDTQKRLLMECVLEWVGRVGKALDNMSLEQRRETLRMVVDEVVVDRGNGVSLTLAIPLGESVVVASRSSPLLA